MRDNLDQRAATWRGVMGVGVLAVATATVLGAAHADEVDDRPIVLESTVSTGFLSVDSGFSDRLIFSGAFDAFLPSGLGLHLELLGEEREEDAGFVAGGASYTFDSFRVKGLLGTSSENDDILPEVFVLLQGSYFSPPEDGYVLTPTFTYRSYRNGASDSTFAFDATKYIDLVDDYLLIAQALGRGTIANPGRNVGFAGGGSIAVAQYNKWQLGVVLEAGDSRYDSVLGAGAVSNDFVSARPFASIRVADNVELFSRVEYYNTDAYDAAGLFFGVKLTTNIATSR